jgi:hypothetical protein
VTATPWRKSTKSGGNGGQCVEVRRDHDRVEVRDSKDPAGPVLSFALAEWHAFLEGTTKGEFDR